MQVASDVVRDGLGVELLDQGGKVVAEVFRSDRDRTVVVTTFDNNVPLDAVQTLIGYALQRLDPFEDATSLATGRGVSAEKVRGSDV